MLYSVLIYDNEAVVERHSPEETQQLLSKHLALQDDLREAGTLGPVARLMPSTSAVTLKKAASLEKTGEKTLVTDGPFAETKEQLVGFYVFECSSLEQAIDKAKMLPVGSSSLEVRPITWFDPGVR